jgi:hypothetical protein
MMYEIISYETLERSVFQSLSVPIRKNIFPNFVYSHHIETALYANECSILSLIPYTQL